MNVSYLSPDGRDSKQSARIELHRNLVYIIGPSVTPTKKKHFEKRQELSYIGAEQHTDTKAPTQEQSSPQAPRSAQQECNL
jgi:hypothetical protein